VIRAVLVTAADLSQDLAATLLFRSNVERLSAVSQLDVRRHAAERKLDVVLVDSALPGASGIVAALRQDPLTRPLAIVALGRSDFGVGQLELLAAGTNAILPLPPGSDWDDRLMRLVNVPLRKVSRFPVDLAVSGGLRSGQRFDGRALNLSVHGMLLECTHVLEIGDDVELEFEMPAGQGQVSGSGTIVRQAAAQRFGVELTHVEGDGRVRIKRYVEGTTD
jgi:CheY-like chemotaxis protein